jgi:S-adenosylmethionine hydrolase
MAASFHGRDLFAPVAARLAVGRMPQDHLVPQPALEVELAADDVSEIIYVDHYGNAVTGLRACAVPVSCVIEAAGQRLGYARVFEEGPQGQAFWYCNSAGLVELALNKGNASAKLGLAIGDPVSVVP